MKGNVLQFEPPAAPPNHVEPVESAVLEVSARVAALNDEKRRLFNRLDELRGLSPSLRRRRARAVPPAASHAVNFYSIEEADADVASAPLQVA
jgi:hypothetical protein